MSVDTHTKGRRLDGYRRTSVDGVEVLTDPDFDRYPVEVRLHATGWRKRGLQVTLSGVDGAACPIKLG